MTAYLSRYIDIHGPGQVQRDYDGDRESGWQFIGMAKIKEIMGQCFIEHPIDTWGRLSIKPVNVRAEPKTGYPIPWGEFVKGER